MAVRKMTQWEVKDWLGNGFVMPGKPPVKPLPQTAALLSPPVKPPLPSV